MQERVIDITKKETADASFRTNADIQYWVWASAIDDNLFYYRTSSWDSSERKPSKLRIHKESNEEILQFKHDHMTKFNDVEGQLGDPQELIFKLRELTISLRMNTLLESE